MRTNRRAVLGGMVAVPAVAVAAIPAHAADAGQWQRRYEEYRRLKGIQNAAEQFGEYYEANEAYGYWKIGFSADGSAPLSDREKIDRDGAWERLDAAQKRQIRDFDEPLDAAIAALVRTPAPTLDAALVKIEVIKEHDLRALREYAPGELMAIVAADMQRFN